MFDKKNKRVLIVDDASIIRKRLAYMIHNKKNVELVGEAKDTESAIELFQAKKPCVVILDLRIPGGGGLQVLETIKQQSPLTMVIVLTNYAYAAYRERCLELGADYFLDKSTEFDRIKKLL